jgi:predicted flap endonuclease-1-like 5' DNA nuclease
VPEEDEIVQAIKGVGPAFRGRLSTAGIENLHDLASANVVWLADVTDIRRPVLSDWIEQARDLLGLSVDLSAEDA